jgi:hypothetical protein
MNSSKSQPARTLAEAELLEALQDLANLRDELAAFERFVKRWPEFVPVPERDLPGLALVVGRQQIPNRFWTLHERRKSLGNIWKGDSLTLSELLVPNEPPEELKEKETYVDRDDETGRQTGWVWGPQVSVDWRRGEFIYEPRTEFQRALYYLFRHSALAKVCGNPDCPAPYFIARKTTQRYCSEKCAQVFQREWKRKWWAERGDTWRRSRKKLKGKLGGKR